MGKTTDDREKRRLVRAWDRSGLSAAEFAEPRGIEAATLRAWGRAIRGPLVRRSRSRPVPRDVSFVEVAATAAVTEPRIEVELRTGRRLNVFGTWTSASVAELARALEAED